MSKANTASKTRHGRVARFIKLNQQTLCKYIEASRKCNGSQQKQIVVFESLSELRLHRRGAICWTSCVRQLADAGKLLSTRLHPESAIKRLHSWQQDTVYDGPVRHHTTVVGHKACTVRVIIGVPVA